jgi:hypothetical protein
VISGLWGGWPWLAFIVLLLVFGWVIYAMTRPPKPPKPPGPEAQKILDELDDADTRDEEHAR